jgi:Circadian oscillating protein COP23
MQLRLFTQILPAVLASTVTSLAISATQPSYAGNNKFFCTQEGNVPMTKIRTSRGNETFIRWVVEDFKKYPALKRCQLVSSRFQRYYDNGKVFITTRNNVNGYPVLCIANRKNTPCTAENILVTLKPGSDTGKVLNQMNDFRRGVGSEALNLSGCQVISLGVKVFMLEVIPKEYLTYNFSPG